jgi:short-subunit dehydrogenase
MSRQRDLRERVVILTGASEGIGVACARALARRGARLVLSARDEEKLHRVAGAMATGQAIVVAGDITVDSAAERLVEMALAQWGRVDVVINNAGVGLYVRSWQAPVEDVRRMMELNFYAPLKLIQAAVPHMRARGDGVIVNVGSIAGKVTLPWLTLYSSTKYALGSLSDGLRVELARYRINVMTVCPGYVNTGFQSHIIGGTVPEKLASSRPFAVTAEECAEAIVRGIERGKRTVVTPRYGWLLIAAARLFPRLTDSRLESFLE